MKDKGISRNIGKGRTRTSGDGPGIGHVNRMSTGSRSSEGRGERRRRRLSDEERAYKERHHQHHHSLLIRWSMLFGLGALAVIALFVMFWLMPYLERRKSTAPGTEEKVVYSVIEKPGEKIPGERESVELAKKALAAATEADVEKFIEADTTPADEVLDYLKNVAIEEGEMIRYDWIARLDTDREDVSGVVVTYRKNDERTNRLVLLSADDNGRWRMNFAAFARLAVPSWEDLMSGRTDSAVVRIYVAEDQYFNGPFREQDGWRCYGIASPDMPDLFYGYCLADSAQDKALAELLSGKKTARATIGLERMEGTSARQFRIKRVLAQDWLIGDEPLDGTGG